MAPEQAAGKGREVGPGADVYALGAMLYECLTGRPPFVGATIADCLAQVQNDEPVPPRRLQPTVPRDLETVCLKCLEKAPERRYASAEALADDLHRFLAGEPVRARPTARWRRLVKWARRRPAVAALALVSSLAVAAAVLGMLWHNARLEDALQRAERAREHARANARMARAAVERMLTRVGEDRLAYVPQMEQARREILRDALDFYLRFLADDATSPAARHDAALAFGRVGRINDLLGKRPEAEAAFEKGIALLRRLGAEFPDEPRYCHDLATQLNGLASLRQGAGRFAEAEHGYRAALDLQGHLVRDFPDEPRYRQQRAAVRHNLAVLLELGGDFAGAEKAYRQAVAGYEALHAANPAARNYRQALALARRNLGVALTTLGRYPEAADLIARGQTLQEKLVKEEPKVPHYRSELAGTHLNRSNLLSAEGRRAEALQAAQDAESLYRRLVVDFPGVPRYRLDLLKTLVNRGEVQTSGGDWGAAHKAYSEARTLGRQLLADLPDSLEVARDLAAALFNEGRLCEREGNLAAAERAFGEARGLLEQALTPPAPPPAVRHMLVEVLRALGAQVSASRPQESERAFRRALELVGGKGPDLPKSPADRRALARVWWDLAVLLRGQRRNAEARKALEAGLAARQALAEAFPSSPACRAGLAHAHAHLADFLAGSGQPGPAQLQAQTAVRIAEQAVKDFPGVPALEAELADCYRTQGDVIPRAAGPTPRRQAYLKALNAHRSLVRAHPDEPDYHRDLAATLYHMAELLLVVQGGQEEACRLAQEAIAEQATAQKLGGTSPEARWKLRTYLATFAKTLLQLGRHAEMERVAARLWELYPSKGIEYMSAAWFLGQCIPLAERDPGLTKEERGRAARAYADRALEWLRLAVKHGYKDARILEQNDGFKALRSRDDFKAILRELRQGTPAPNSRLRDFLPALPVESYNAGVPLFRRRECPTRCPSPNSSSASAPGTNRPPPSWSAVTNPPSAWRCACGCATRACAAVSTPATCASPSSPPSSCAPRRASSSWTAPKTLFASWSASRATRSWPRSVASRPASATCAGPNRSTLRPAPSPTPGRAPARWLPDRSCSACCASA
jgi:tetratricopeptide (TPR) repeat protein